MSELENTQAPRKPRIRGLQEAGRAEWLSVTRGLSYQVELNARPPDIDSQLHRGLSECCKDMRPEMTGRC